MTGTVIQGIIRTSSGRFWDSSTGFLLEALGIRVVLIVTTSSDRYLKCITVTVTGTLSIRAFL